MRQVIMNFSGHHYQMNKENDSWLLVLPKSDVQVNYKEALSYLLAPNPLLMPCEVGWQNDAVFFKYSLEPNDLNYADIQKMSQLNKIRLGINMGKLVELLELPLTFFIDPENMQFDQNLIPKLAYRGLVDVMPPKKTSYEDFLRQYKSFVISLLYKQYDFKALYDGNLDRIKSAKLIQKVKEAKSVDEVQNFLSDVYVETAEKERNTLRTVPKRKYTIYQQLSIWFGIFVVLLLLPLGYFSFFKFPTQNALLNADTAYLKSDYSEVIRSLEKVNVKDIGRTQKYELAYSFIQGEHLNDAQKKVILKNITLKSDEDYLEYWIYNGRGEIDKSLDIATKLTDVDLTLYAYKQKISQLKADTKMKGEERQAEIEKFQQKYDQYFEKYKEDKEDKENTKSNGKKNTNDTKTDKNESDQNKLFPKNNEKK